MGEIERTVSAAVGIAGRYFSCTEFDFRETIAQIARNALIRHITVAAVFFTFCISRYFTNVIQFEKK